MSTVASAIVLHVRAAESRIGREVYALASIPKRAKASRLGAPGTPTGFKFKLDSIGNVLVSWDCKNPVGAQGTIYDIERSIDGGKRTYVGFVGKKKFIDPYVHSGSKQVTYYIRARRGGSQGSVGIFNVFLGNDGSLPVTMQVGNAPPVAGGVKLNDIHHSSF